jgi:hypothetical protein
VRTRPRRQRQTWQARQAFLVGVGGALLHIAVEAQPGAQRGVARAEPQSRGGRKRHPRSAAQPARVPPVHRSRHRPVAQCGALGVAAPLRLPRAVPEPVARGGARLVRQQAHMRPYPRRAASWRAPR